MLVASRTEDSLEMSVYGICWSNGEGHQNCFFPAAQAVTVLPARFVAAITILSLRTVGRYVLRVLFQHDAAPPHRRVRVRITLRLPVYASQFVLNMLVLCQVYVSHIQHVIENSSFCIIHKSSVSPGFAKQIMPVLHILCYNGSLVTWTVVRLTTAKFKPLIVFCLGLNCEHVHSHDSVWLVLVACTLQSCTALSQQTVLDGGHDSPVFWPTHSPDFSPVWRPVRHFATEITHPKPASSSCKIVSSSFICFHVRHEPLNLRSI
jgi:hypothetical protein